MDAFMRSRHQPSPTLPDDYDGLTAVGGLLLMRVAFVCTTEDDDRPELVLVRQAATTAAADALPQFRINLIGFREAILLAHQVGFSPRVLDDHKSFLVSPFE